MTNFERGFVELARYALIDDESCPALPDGFSYEVAYTLAETQQLTPLMYYGACKTPDFLMSSAMMTYFTRTCEYISISEMQMSEYARIAARFEEAGIDYAPVKGVVTKSLYPQPDMRLMGDCDILIRKEQYEKINAVMEELGYTGEPGEGHEFTYNHPNGVEIELHHQLVPTFEKDLYTYFGDGWKFQRPVEGYAHRYEMSPEDAFIFSFGHFVKHYRLHGAGMKYVLDFRQYMVHYPDLDMDYIREGLGKLNLDEFLDNILRVLDVWFNGAPSDERTDFLTTKLITESTFGMEENGSLSEALREEENKRVKSGGDTDTKINAGRARRRRWLHNIFLPYSDMCLKYPVLEKWAILLPLFWVVRIFDVLFFHRDRLKENAQKMDNTLTQEQLEQYKKDLALVGLTYNYEEFESEWQQMVKEKEKEKQTTGAGQA